MRFWFLWLEVDTQTSVFCIYTSSSTSFSLPMSTSSSSSLPATSPSTSEVLVAGWAHRQMAGQPLIVRVIYCFTPGPATPRRPPQPPFSDILFHPRFLFNFSKISISSSNDALCEVCWHSFNHLKPSLHWSTFVPFSDH